MDAAELYLGVASLPSADPALALRGLWSAWRGGRPQLPSRLAWSHGRGRCRRSGWQHRSREISSLLILIACDGREIYGSELQFVRGSNTPY